MFTCRIGIHFYEMFQYVSNKGRFKTMGRSCIFCSKTQIAVRPKEYHPTKYVWADENNRHTSGN